MNKTIHVSLTLMAATLVFAGCSTRVSRDISPQGVAGEVIFPDADDTTLPGGSFPNIQNLRLVKPGVTKEQLYYLLGRPHFAEGFARVREWDYLFHFRVGDTVRDCQYKVIFDRDYLGRSFHWLPEECASVLDEVKPTLVVGESGGKVFRMSGDGLFAFGRSGMQDLSREGRAELSRIAQALSGSTVGLVDILAHADRIGSEEANRALSNARARSVRDYLVSEGVDEVSIRAIGMGESQPVKLCDASAPRDVQIACLAPNRRVEVRASARSE